jgi:hypothetical protein
VNKRGFIIIAAFAVFALLIAVLSLKGSPEKVRNVSGRIVSIDAASRTASLEIVHPKTGATLQLEGHVPLDCNILIDGRPASLAELRAGERVDVEGIIHRDRTLSANRVRASRAETEPASQPASTQAAPTP